MNNLLKIITKLEVPVISVIRSHCYGAGFIIAMHSDIIIAAESSSFCIPASKLNIQIPKKQILHLLTKINKGFFKDIIFSFINKKYIIFSRSVQILQGISF